ncbi:SNARE associated Golgi protein [Phaeobacter piscinae]|uniref:SNARE associated Golgi protein n=1 Tax=Phaeobacter piscinae TaxID=1580596 RepID=A0AAN1GSI9_9RHOB|nr:DedA family protein [Phaeobacter piscinae]ATG44231.1 SNARE associated Golgi protein [Phaeobacter piscinae]AUQ73597.1 SNARE associated Golgi protein [Phaeobacter piscinae]AUR36541.1 SNARE associated Golgi protein [Phaeobacter piscinae]
MTDAFLALIPTYGPWIIFVSVTLSCLAVPIPSSLMVMTAGGFAAAGDFLFLELVGFAFVGFAVGDQILYWASRGFGTRLIAKLLRRQRASKVIERAQTLIDRRGLFAIFLTRTALSPLGPYVGCLSGALKHSWVNFTLPALAGGVVWTICYATLGFTFAGHISQIASLITGSVGMIVAGTVAVVGVIVLYNSYAQHAKGSKGDPNRA